MWEYRIRLWPVTFGPDGSGRTDERGTPGGKSLSFVLGLSCKYRFAVAANNESWCHGTRGRAVDTALIDEPVAWCGVRIALRDFGHALLAEPYAGAQDRGRHAA